MGNETIKEEIIKSAHFIGTPEPLSELFDSQLSYWLSVQALIKSGGYEAVRKRYPRISREVAEKVEKSSFKALRNFCSSEISTLGPCLPDSTILNMLSTPNKAPEFGARMMLQLLSESKEEEK